MTVTTCIYPAARGLCPGLWATLVLAVGAFLPSGGYAEERVEAAIERLTEAREEIAAERIPLEKNLNALQSEIRGTREEVREAEAELRAGGVDADAVAGQVRALREGNEAVQALLLGFSRDQRERSSGLEKPVATDSDADVFGALDAAFSRLEAAIGGDKWEAQAALPDGSLTSGWMAKIGPMVYFSGPEAAGPVERGEHGLPLVRSTGPEGADAVRAMMAGEEAAIPLDPTGNEALRIASTQDDILGHVRRGGPVMIPILGLGVIGLLVFLGKCLDLMLLSRGPRDPVAQVMEAYRSGGPEAAVVSAGNIRGPVGHLLATGAAAVAGEGRSAIERAVSECILALRPRLERLLPILTVIAGTAPLLGLLGTVTGMIRTFDLITVFGTGDAAPLADGISEALITTEFGLLVAIPIVLGHAFLARLAARILGEMESAAAAFVNAIDHTSVG